ncbi:MULTISPECIES: DUF6343 family protein [Streptomycetaceae]|uniref:Uncharacterized protein n=1 Tax=Streptantibioticus cattleyicolor (strain ATCC 35852 / DSM 46488 / JCM 4925 / NBRC 14057 / NRRL 8057) TaxID=1003195 RepID=F8JZI2_STREN|nr:MULTISPECIES: DUF6343 family protein [Streptomycetaceae]AEW97283.1 hypothetical protein SCATT_49120 [Streptantibioticus cattleyicolor NRRL 8057 = DSM 46488]MYS61736.1 hypothetical protein [Streptomyces sp. SID5468]CCB77604.1 Integral membrane protein (modular protein) [Streptantibioticus cattleyicolor NRRL 8057 = DSM 46488]
MRTGSEPTRARSPLRLRVALTLFGLVWALAAAGGFAAAGEPGWAGFFGAIALVAVVDLAVVVHHIRQGPHYQPGRDIPPYWPADDEPRHAGRPGRRGVWPSARRRSGR